MTPKASIIISTFNRTQLLKRTLWSIATRPPSVEFEVVLVDDGSTEDTLSVLKSFSSKFMWTYVRYSSEEFEKRTGVKRFWNNPSSTQNVGFKHSRGEFIYQQGNEVIAWYLVYDRLLTDCSIYSRPLVDSCENDNFIVFSTTCDIPQHILKVLDDFGTNLGQAHVDYCAQWPLQSAAYRSDVSNYLSCCSRSLWEKIGGYDERYVAGISSEDSDFVRRARAVPGGCYTTVLPALSLHQNHMGKSCYAEPDPSVISQERFQEGCDINHRVYHDWTPGEYRNQQPWEWGVFGVVDVVKNWK